MLAPSRQRNRIREDMEAENVERNTIAALLIIEVGLVLLVIVEFAFLLERCA
jgi:hypothetical protein